MGNEQTYTMNNIQQPINRNQAKQELKPYIQKNSTGSFFNIFVENSDNPIYDLFKSKNVTAHQLQTLANVINFLTIIQRSEYTKRNNQSTLINSLKSILLSIEISEHNANNIIAICKHRGKSERHHWFNFHTNTAQKLYDNIKSELNKNNEYNKLPNCGIISHKDIQKFYNKDAKKDIESKINPWIQNILKSSSHLTFSNGNVYMGAVNNNGVINGYGVGVLPDGTKYEGYWENDKMHGYGLQTYQDGSIYKGNWNGGKRNGYGVEVLKNGEKYEGYWKNDKMHGDCTIVFEDDSSISGKFNNGLLQGYATVTDHKGNKCKMYYKDDISTNVHPDDKKLFKRIMATHRMPISKEYVVPRIASRHQSGVIFYKMVMTDAITSKKFSQEEVSYFKTLLEQIYDTGMQPLVGMHILLNGFITTNTNLHLLDIDGHAIYFQRQKIKNIDMVKLTIYNSGLGVSNHSGLDGCALYLMYNETKDAFIKQPPTKDAIYKTIDGAYFQIFNGKINNDFKLIDPNQQPVWNNNQLIQNDNINTLFKGYIRLDNNLNKFILPQEYIFKDDINLLCNLNETLSTQDFYKLLDKQCYEKVDMAKKFKNDKRYYQAMQKHGNCVVESLNAWLRMSLIEKFDIEKGIALYNKFNIFILQKYILDDESVDQDYKKQVQQKVNNRVFKNQSTSIAALKNARSKLCIGPLS